MTTYYVGPTTGSTSGSNSYDGLEETYISGTTGPFGTVSYAVSAATNGDTVIVLTGTHVETSAITMQTGIILSGRGSGDTVITLAGTTPELYSGNPIIDVYSAYNVTITNLQLLVGGHHGISFGPTSGSLINNCRIHLCEHNAIYANWCEASTAVNMVISGCGFGGPTLRAEASGYTYSDHILKDTVMLGIGTNDFYFTGNNVYYNAGIGVHCNGSSGLTNSGISIHQNKIHHCGQNAIQFINTDDSSINRNLIYENAETSAIREAYWASVYIGSETANTGSVSGAMGANRINIIGNTFHDGRFFSCIEFGPRAGAELVGASACTVFNNIFMCWVGTGDMSRIVKLPREDFNNPIEPHLSGTHAVDGSSYPTNNFANKPLGGYPGSNWPHRDDRYWLAVTFRDYQATGDTPYIGIAHGNPDYRLTDTAHPNNIAVTSYSGVASPRYDLDAQFGLTDIGDAGAYQAGWPIVSLAPNPPVEGARDGQPVVSTTSRRLGSRQVEGDRS